MNDAQLAQHIVREIEHSIDVVHIRELAHTLAQLVPGYEDITKKLTVITYKRDKRFELFDGEHVISFGGLDALNLAIKQQAPCVIAETISR